MFGGAISALLTKDRVSWQQACARMLVEYESSKPSDPGIGKEDKSEQANSAKASQRKRKAKCYYCKKLGHIKKDCYKWKRDQKKKQDCEDKKGDDDDKALSAHSPCPCHCMGNDSAMVARDEDTGPTDHMMKNDLIIMSSRKNVSTDITTAGTSLVKANLEVGAEE